MDFMLFDDGCGRYGLGAKPADIVETFDLGDEGKEILNEMEKQGLLPTYDAKPTNKMPVVVYDEELKRMKVQPMYWGFQPVWSDDTKWRYKLFNTRDDKLTSRTWSSSAKTRRALIPTTGYFEWTKVPKGSDIPKQKFLFKPKDSKVFSLAGIYMTRKDGDGKEIGLYSILTTEPNKEARTVHNRMPVIVHQEDRASWLDPSKTELDDIKPFLHPYEDNGLDVVEVPTDTKSLQYNDEGRIAPLNSK